MNAHLKLGVECENPRSLAQARECFPLRASVIHNSPHTKAYPNICQYWVQLRQLVFILENCSAIYQEMK